MKRNVGLALLAAVVTTAAVAIAAEDIWKAKPAPPDSLPVGGANSPKISPPPKFVLTLGELKAKGFALRVPTGEYTAPKGGAPNYSVAGPVAAVQGADGVWRGHGYLETYPRLLKFSGKLDRTTAELTYTFEKDKTYKVRLRVDGEVVRIDEQCDLGPRNLWVFDCTYGGWTPSAGFAMNPSGDRHAFAYLPCYYDKPEITVNPIAAMKAAGGHPDPADFNPPWAAFVLAGDPTKKDMAGFWCRDIHDWTDGDRMGFQLWQRRQLPGDPGSRHFLGPETKSDSTPNPRTAPMLGRSLYEGHVTVEFNLGVGSRKLSFSAAAKPTKRGEIPGVFGKMLKRDWASGMRDHTAKPAPPVQLARKGGAK